MSRELNQHKLDLTSTLGFWISNQQQCNNGDLTGRLFLGLTTAMDICKMTDCMAAGQNN
jgi:hypothetical protein